MTNTVFLRAFQSILMPKTVNENRKNGKFKGIKRFRSQVFFLDSRSIHKNAVIAGHRK